MSTSQFSRGISSTPLRRFLTNEQLHQLLSIAKEDPRLHDLFDVASIVSRTGLRMRELANLRWVDIDFPNSRLVIASPMNSNVRNVPFESTTSGILEARRSRNPASLFVLGDKPMAVLIRVADQLRHVGSKIGAGPVYMQTLRHTFFMRLMAAGADSLTLMSIGGYRPSSLKYFFNHTQLSESAVRYQKQVEEQR